ncbi:MAG: NAD(P)-dependent oxidoreductase [Pseudomonadota bacterium]
MAYIKVDKAIVIVNVKNVLLIDSALCPVIDDLRPESKIVGNNAQLIYVQGVSHVTDKQFEQADVVVSYFGSVLNQECINKLKQCKGIVAATTGFNHIDIKAATLHSIPVCNISDYGHEDIADHTMMLMLALVRKLPKIVKHTRETRQCDWRAAQGAMRLKGKNLGILGFGKIGVAVAQRAFSFGLNIFYYDPYVHECADSHVHKIDTLEEFLKKIDILSIHCPLTEKTNKLINKDALSLLKKGAVIINTARGQIIDEKSLITLFDQYDFSLGLDVLENESCIPTEFLESDRVLVTPHSAFYTTDALEKMRHLAIVSAVNFLIGKKERNNIIVPFSEKFR